MRLISKTPTSVEEAREREHLRYYMPDGCARCMNDDESEDGHHVVYRRFFGEPIESEGRTFTHWGICPITGDPVILAIEPTEGDDG